MSKKVNKYKVFGRVLARDAVRNVDFFEELHSGIFPSSKTGDYSDVVVKSPYGEIPWKELSRFSDEEMRKLMLEIEKRIVKCLKNYDKFKEDDEFINKLSAVVFGKYGISWDNPQHDRPFEPETQNTLTSDQELREFAIGLSDDPAWKKHIKKLTTEEIAGVLRQNGFEIE